MSQAGTFSITNRQLRQRIPHPVINQPQVTAS
jgi:hypothetical protein